MFTLLSTFFHEHLEIFYLVFGGIILAFMVYDLGFANRRPHKISFKSAVVQSGIWVAISMAFGLLLYTSYDKEEGINYFAAYVTEYALSVDNIFVIIMILRYFHIDEAYYHKILFWGILGAIVMRALFIFLASYLIAHAHWILYVFGAFLLITGFKMLFSKEDDKDYNPEQNPIMKFARRFLNFTHHSQGGKFFFRKRGILFFTPLFMVVLLVESTDLIFAVDSIPAAFAITDDRHVLFTSNIFAVMGLRAMFFMLAGILDRFYLLSKGLAFVLIFIGGKMFIEVFHDINLFAAGQDGAFFQAIHKLLETTGLGTEHKVPAIMSLGVIVAVLTLSIVLSMIFPKKTKAESIPDEAKSGAA